MVDEAAEYSTCSFALAPLAHYGGDEAVESGNDKHQTHGYDYPVKDVDALVPYHEQYAHYHHYQRRYPIVCFHISCIFYIK